VVTAWSFAASGALGWALQRTLGFRVPADDEVAGIDSAEHAETAYDLDALGAGAILPRGQSVAEARLPGGRPG
jgi:Amt family ammonium transporter